MKSLCVAVNINKKKVIQKKVFDEIIFIKSLFVSYGKALNLKSRHLAHKIGIIAVACANNNIFERLFVINLEILTALNFLAVCGRFDKFSYLRLEIDIAAHCGSDSLSLCIGNAQIHSGNALNTFY